MKGLASGFEHVTTLDLIITMSESDRPPPDLVTPDRIEISNTVRSLMLTSESVTPSHLYLELLRHGIRNGWELAEVDLRFVTTHLIGEGYCIDEKSGRFQPVAAT